MSWLSDFYSKAIKKGGEIVNTVNKYNPILANYHLTNTVDDFIQNEVIDKSDLRGAEVESVLSGLPIVGDVVKGVEGVNQLEDLYDRTGKVPAYPAETRSGGAGIGRAVGTLTRKIENGTHDLAEYYSGEKLGPMPVEGVDYVTGDKYVNQ